jgi:hypothetical protein
MQMPISAAARQTRISDSDSDIRGIDPMTDEKQQKCQIWMYGRYLMRECADFLQANDIMQQDNLILK